MAETIILFSTKGGVGKTLIAVNLAISLAKERLKKICLLDLDVRGISDAARMLNLKPERAMVDLLEALKKQPETFNKDSFIIKSEFGIDFLSGVLKPQQASYLETERVEEVFKLLNQHYDYIIVDAGNSFNDLFAAGVNNANLLLLVLTPDILSIYKIKWALETLQYFHIPQKMIKIVLNRAESVSSISWQEVMLNCPIEIISKIPSEGKFVGHALNRGIPVVIDNPKAKFSREISNLSQALISTEGLYVKRQGTDKLTLKDLPLEKSGKFWQKEGLAEAPVTTSLPVEQTDALVLLKRRIHNRLIEELNLKRLDATIFSDENKSQELRKRAELLVSNLVTEEAGMIPSVQSRKVIVKEIIDAALGLGPLEDLISDQEITDIMVNNRSEVYIERHGKIERTDRQFLSNDQVRTTIERIIAPLGRRIDESVPMVDARLADGSRVNAIIPPLSLTGPTLTIRKFRKERYKIEELVELKTLSKDMAEFIKASVVCRKNVIVSGGTGSGKTTVLNVLSAFIPRNERIITIEDAAELKLDQEHWIRLESKPPNIEGKGSVTIRDLFRNTLRMRPDRIIIGECRGIETLDMLQAMNTGHDGSMTTIHANSTYDVLSRLDTMILMSGVELPIRAIREMIASAVDVIVHTSRLSDGTRKVIQITELTGMADEMHIGLKDVFLFKQTGIDKQGNVLGDFSATGYTPSFLDEIKVKGIPLSESIFKAS